MWMIIGLGALGSHIADGLLRQDEALILIDPDVVEKENLRHTLYLPGDVGKAKVKAFEDHVSQEWRVEGRIITRTARFELLPEEDREKLIEKTRSVILATDSRESRISILTHLPPGMDVYNVSMGLESGEVMRGTADQVRRVLETKRGFSCETRRLHPSLPRLTASLFLALHDQLGQGEAVRITRTPLSTHHYTF